MSKTINRIRAAAKIVHDEGLSHGWFGSCYKKTYAELETSDPIGFVEFNDIISRALDAARSPTPPLKTKKAASPI